MHYILARLRAIKPVVTSLRGLLLGSASGFAILALIVGGTMGKVLAAVAVVIASAVMLLISTRQAELHRSRISSSGYSETGRRSQPDEVAAPEIMVPTPANRTAERVAIARSQIQEWTRRHDSPVFPVRYDIHQESHHRYDSTNVLVSVIVPCFNEETHIAAALESVARQSERRWECIVVDDASTDQSVREVARYVETDRRFRLVRHQINGGLSAARNTGVRAAKGLFVTFLDGDDMLMRDSLSDRLAALDEDSAVDVAGSYTRVQPAPVDIGPEDLPDHRPWMGERTVVDFVTTNGDCPFNVHAPLLRADIVRAYGGFDESVTGGCEDWEFWTRILRGGYRFVPAKRTTAIYRMKPRSMAAVKSREHVEAATHLIAAAQRPHESVWAPDDAVVPMSRPVHEYAARLSAARRMLEFGAMALLTSGVPEAEEILAPLGESSWSLLDRHLDIRSVLLAGFARALGVTAAEMPPLELDIQPAMNEALRLVHRSLSPSPRSPAPPPPKRFQTLLVPQNRFHVDLMKPLANADSTAILVTDRITGGQGAREAALALDVEVVSENELVLQGIEFKRLVVAFPYDGLARSLMEDGAARGVEIVELDFPERELLQVDATPAALTSTKLRKAADVGDAVGGTPAAIPPTVLADSRIDSAFWLEERVASSVDRYAMARFKDLHKGERCVIIGNGPSLNKLDLGLIASENTIGVNGIFYAEDAMGFELTYYVVEDTMVVKDNLDAIKSYRAGHKFFPSIYRDQIGTADNITYFLMNGGYYAGNSPSFCVPKFSIDPSQRIYSGQSVTTMNLQLAYHMGFQEVILIGMDFSYTVPDDAEIDGNHIISQGDDPNHFHPDYFGKGKVWKDPKLDRVLANYQLAKLMYEADGRRIINATAGGKLELFERVSYGELFS